jgi:uncharacterized protein YggU (UPF0235/DUF167 family)
MKISVRVKPNSKVDKIEEVDNRYVIWVKEKAVDGKANNGVCELLAKEFGVKLEM